MPRAATGWLGLRAYLEQEPGVLPRFGHSSRIPEPHCHARRDGERMAEVFDIYTIIFLALAVFIFLRLRSVLGQRTGRERPPYDPYSARDAVRSPAGEKVVTLPQRGADAPPRPAEATAPAAER